MNPDQNPAPQDQPAPEAPAMPPVTPPAAEPAPSPMPEAPAPQPEQFEQPAAPNPFGPPVEPIGSSPAPAAQADPMAAPAPALAPQSGSKKKLIIILSAVVGGLLLLGGIAAALYLVFFSVGKQDYQAAYDQLNVIQESIDESSVSTGTTEETITSAKTAFEEYKIEHAKLASLKAIQFDGEVNEKYKAYATKADAFIAFTEALFPSMTAFLEAADAMGSFSLTSASVQRAIDAFEVASEKVTDPTLKAYVDQTLALYKEMLLQVKIYEDTSNSTSARIAAANKISDIARGASSDASDMSEELKDRYEEVNPEDAFDALSKLVTDKLNNS